jgi:RNA polymerase subunit RPABC4/transcription elongation factor Spt4
MPDSQKVYKRRCESCRTPFEAHSKYAKTCSDACRQRKWRGQVITTDADALEMVFGAHAADRLQDYYMGRAS